MFFSLYIPTASTQANMVNFASLIISVILSIIIGVEMIIPLIIFTSFQLVLCNFVTACSGVSLIWNLQNGFLISNLLKKNKSDNMYMVLILIAVTVIANIYFLYQKMPRITHLAHLLGFLVGIVTGAIF
jgi:hypothetical protein